MLNTLLETYYLNSILVKREILRQRKDYVHADEIRDALEKAGIEILDFPSGVGWKFKEKK